MQEEETQAHFMFNLTIYPVPLNLSIFQAINSNIFRCMYRDHVYNVQSNVSLEVFQAFINYLFQIDTTVPNITPDNYYQYILLNQEFQSSTMNDLIESKRSTFDEVSMNLANLQNPLIQDKSYIESIVASHFDDYVVQHGELLISFPTTLLYRILSHENVVFNQHNRFYELIVSRYQSTNDIDIFCLLTFLKFRKLTPENQRDSVEQQNFRCGMIPEIDIISEMNKLDHIKENVKKFSQLFIQLFRSFCGHNINENYFIESFERGNIRHIFSLHTDVDGIQYELNFIDLTAKFDHTIKGEVQEIVIPKSIFYKNVEFIVTSVGKDVFNYSNVNRIVFQEDSQVRFIHENEFYACLFQSLTLPPLLEDFPLSGFVKILESSRLRSKDQIIGFDSIHLWPNSRNYTKFDERLLLGKSDINSDIFDMLICAKNAPEVNIPDFIKYICPLAFRECNATTINISENSQLKIIKERVFSYSCLTSITIPSHIVGIEPLAFGNCKNLRTVNFAPDSELKIIKEKAFLNSGLASITIPSHIVQIEPSTFENCQNLRTVDFAPDSELQIIKEKAFLNSGLASITIPSHVVQIESLAFENCQNLRTVDFAPDSELHTFNGGIFSKCSVQDIAIPCNVEELKDGWFNGISRSCHISISAENPNFAFVSEKLLLGKSDRSMDNFDVLLYALRDSEEIDVPDFIKKIGRYAFADCKNLRTVRFSLDSQLSVIDVGAFERSSLEMITISSHVTQINICAFADCKSLRSVEYSPNSELRSINECLFKGSSIENIVIPPSVEILDKFWYKGLNEHFRFSISPENHNFSWLNEKILLGKTNPSNDDFDVIVFAKRDIRSIEIPSFIKKIGSCAFESCKHLTRINIPMNITEIGDYAFSECTSLRECEFAQNSELQIIGKNAFAETILNRIFIPQHVIKIDSFAFYRCKNLQSFRFHQNCELRIIGESAFMCSSIPSIQIPSSVTQIMDNAFSDCGLKTIVFPENSQLETIGKYVFYSHSIKNATVPPHLARLITIIP